MNFDPGYALSLLPLLAEGLGLTLLATLLGMSLALLLGLLLAIVRHRRLFLLTPLAGALVEFIRSTPLLIQLYLLYYVLPEFGLRLPALATGVLALGLHYACYCAEVYRAGIESVPAGQWEAARALGLPAWTTWRRVILPQALPPQLPALGNYLIAMFKDTPLLSAITVLELLQVARLEAAESFRYLEPLTLVGLIFLLVSLLAAAALRGLEHWLARRRHA